MVFKGIGLIWNPKTKRALVNFRHVDTFETNEESEIELLLKAEGISVLYDKEPSKSVEMTKKDLVLKARALGITGADRMSKSELTERLEECKSSR